MNIHLRKFRNKFCRGLPAFSLAKPAFSSATLDMPLLKCHFSAKFSREYNPKAAL